MTTPELHVTDDLATEAAAAIVALRPRSLALAGGSTPRPVYERLAAAALPWSEIDVWFGDERCVPPDDPDSNYRMAHEALLAHVAARVHRMPGETCDALAYERELTRVYGDGVPRLDLALLGLGDDGHTASLFPGDPALEERDRLVAHVQRADHARLTLTLPVLSAASVAIFLVAGERKREPLRRLLAGDRAIPAACVDAARVVVFADRAAAG
jgi:6-phosphogluconolactonase